MIFPRKKGENIADLGGLKMAYQAYSEKAKSNDLSKSKYKFSPIFLARWVTEHGAELKLPDLAYPPQQLFWVQKKSSKLKHLNMNIFESYSNIQTLDTKAKAHTNTNNQLIDVPPN